jgi:hypothetical protein
MQKPALVAACPLFLTCTLGRSISMREALRVWQGFYCEGVFARCERYKLASSGREIPEGLLPNGRLQGSSPGSPPPPTSA